VPAVPSTAGISTLDDGALGQLCDWINNNLGGYASTIRCESGQERRNPATQTECVPTIRFEQAGCTMTVAEFEDCVVERARSKGCEWPPFECAPLFHCNLRDR
jgi:hypothetical protein